MEDTSTVASAVSQEPPVQNDVASAVDELKPEEEVKPETEASAQEKSEVAEAKLVVDVKSEIITTNQENTEKSVEPEELLVTNTDTEDVFDSGTKTLKKISLKPFAKGIESVETITEDSTTKSNDQVEFIISDELCEDDVTQNTNDNTADNTEKQGTETMYIELNSDQNNRVTIQRTSSISTEATTVDDSVTFVEAANGATDEMSNITFVVVNQDDVDVSINGLSEEITDELSTAQVHTDDPLPVTVLSEVTDNNIEIELESDNSQPEQNVVILGQEDEYSDEGNDSPSSTNEESETVQPAGKVKEIKIPCHVLGRNIENPLEDHVRNGRTLLKPRLGVKIPYRNLTSQIVSKQDLTDEIMERSRQRQSTVDPPVGGDVFFAKKLTQRLAKKLTYPSKGGSTKTSKTTSKKTLSRNAVTPVASSISSTPSTSIQVSNTTPETSNEPEVAKITDNSDLIALLEGDGDDTDWLKSSPKTEKLEKRPADWEKETALKQLSSINFNQKDSSSKSAIVALSQKEIVSKTLVQNEVSIKPPVTVASSPKEPKTSTASSSQSSASSLEKEPSPKTPTAVVASSTLKEPALKPPPHKDTPRPPKNAAGARKTSSSDDDITNEPRFSSNLVTKTYTRKRKPSDEIKSMLQVSPIKSTSSESTSSTTPSPKSLSVTVTKTSPDSSPPKLSPITAKPPSGDSSSKAPPFTPITPINIISASATIQRKISNSNLQKAIDKKQITITVAKKEREPTTPVTSENEFKVLSPNTYISKSSRIIKRKKIWDPDEATPVLKSPVLKLNKPIAINEKLIDKKPPVLKPSNEVPVPSQQAVLKPSNEKSPTKKVIMNKTIEKRKKKKKPKRLTEIDKLLMDEGAVNLLYSVKNTEEIQNMNKRKKKKTLISLDRAQRELLNKTNEIKNDLQISSTKDSPISLRKKEGIMLKPSPSKDMQRKKSKDSMSGSNHSPPASPGFAYSQPAEASRIIRRHSSSSFSSDVDHQEEKADRNLKHKTEPVKKKSRIAIERRPPSNRTISTGIDKQLLNEEMAKNFCKIKTEEEYAQFEAFSVRKFDHLTQIILAPTSTNGQATFTVHVLIELAVILELLDKDDSCRVVLISSSGSSFCQGINYKELVSNSKTECRSFAESYTICIRDFLTSLSKFSKILVAGVHGSTVGLGVTMLPLFDMVLASDTATFSTPYAQLGCAAEGGVLLTHPHIMHNALASELFFASRKLTSAEALRLGLVTRTLWPDKFQEELIASLKAISAQSLQSMKAIKKQLRRNLLDNIDASLKAESSILIKHWTSNECQTNFNNYRLENE